MYPENVLLYYSIVGDKLDCVPVEFLLIKIN